FLCVSYTTIFRSQVVGEKFSDQELCGNIVKLSSCYLLFTGCAFLMRQLQKSLVDFFIGSRRKVFSKKVCQCGIHGCTHVQDSFHFSEKYYYVFFYGFIQNPRAGSARRCFLSLLICTVSFYHRIEEQSCKMIAKNDTILS